MNDYPCYECLYSHFYKGAVRGLMDADPDEWDCDKEEYDFFFEDWERDDEGDLIECPHYCPGYYDLYYYPDEGPDRYDELKDEGLL